MKSLMSSIIAATFALSSAVCFGASVGPDIEAGTHLSMRECLAMQAAKHDGASRDEMKRACQWTLDSDGSDSPAAGSRSRAADAAPNAVPNGMEPPTSGH